MIATDLKEFRYTEGNCIWPLAVWTIFCFLFFAFFGGTGVWTQGPCLLGWYSTTWGTLPSHFFFFCFSYFSGRILSVCPHQYPPSFVSLLLGQPPCTTMPSLLVEVGSYWFFSLDCPWALIFLLSTSLVAGITAMSCCTRSNHALSLNVAHQYSSPTTSNC
jgi:hypothetical protein